MSVRKEERMLKTSRPVTTLVTVKTIFCRNFFCF